MELAVCDTEFSFRFMKTQQVVLLPQLEGSWFKPEFGLLSVWRFACSPHVCMEFFQVLWLLPISQKHEMCVCDALRWSGIPSRVYQWVHKPSLSRENGRNSQNSGVQNLYLPKKTQNYNCSQ